MIQARPSVPVLGGPQEMHESTSGTFVPIVEFRHDRSVVSIPVGRSVAVALASLRSAAVLL